CAATVAATTSTVDNAIRSCLTDKPFETAELYRTSAPMTPALQPTLTGKLLELRPLRPGDFDALYAVASDPGIWAQHPVADRYKKDVFTGFFREARESGGAFAVFERQSGRIIGSSRYYGYDAARREIEIGWTFLARAYWGGACTHPLK